MDYINQILSDLKAKDADQPEFLQAVEEVLSNVGVIFERHPEYQKHSILERLVEPERVVMFKVPWTDDTGKIRVNRGFRVQFNSAIGPYKGGLRFHPSVNLGLLKFLGFEQNFKNALTTLPIGGGKGGSDFNPKGKSDGEVMRFCQSFMTELYRHIGPDIDVPAGDMGVGSREIGYMYGQYRRIKGASEQGVLTGKGLSYGGSLARTEATGFGVVYFLIEMLETNGIEYKGKKAVVSGSGNVAIYAVQKAAEYGIKTVAMSDSQGYIYDENLDLAAVKQIKESERGSLEGYPTKAGRGVYTKGSVYDADIKADFVLPCGTQNEINLDRAKRIVANGCLAVVEGANMPDDNEAIAYYLQNKIFFGPGKAANAGGVATSALEMSQNSMRLAWSFEEVDEKLHGIMKAIHRQCRDAMKEYGLEAYNYVAGANIAGMTKIISAMLAQGDF